MFGLNMTSKERKELIALTELAIQHFNVGDWKALGAYTGQLDLIARHDRLIRSLNFGDDDYSGHAHEIMHQLVERDRANLNIISEYLQETYSIGGVSVSTASSQSRQITFAPSVFELPDGGLEDDLISVMSPFLPQFEPVFETIKEAAFLEGYRCLRAKDIWEHSSVIQDVFSLIFKAHIVVCDFTGKNPNVFYEAGIAHTLGKHVVPITQAANDIPFDLQHHRYLSYLNNIEGRVELGRGIKARFLALK